MKKPKPKTKKSFAYVTVQCSKTSLWRLTMVAELGDGAHFRVHYNATSAENAAAAARKRFPGMVVSAVEHVSTDYREIDDPNKIL